jgi:hypothetical protein
MRITYTARLTKPILLEDHWSAPFMHGRFRPIEESGKVVAFEVAFAGQPNQFAPGWDETASKERPTITIRDRLLPSVRQYLQSALSFIQCYLDIDVALDEIAAVYSGETDEEEKEIAIKSWHFT